MLLELRMPWPSFCSFSSDLSLPKYKTIKLRAVQLPTSSVFSFCVLVFSVSCILVLTGNLPILYVCASLVVLSRLIIYL